MTIERGRLPAPSRPRARSRLGPVWITGLALLGAPRVVLHDLDVLADGTSVASLALTVVPMAIWTLVLVARRVDAPLRDGVAIGAVYGILLAGIHQLLWDRAFEDDPPRLGGNLKDKLNGGAEEVVLRAAAVVSSLGVGIALGAIAGSVSLLVLRERTSRQHGDV